MACFCLLQVQHACVVAAQAKQVENSGCILPQDEGSYRNHTCLTFFTYRFFAKICQEKKHNQIFYNNFINGNTMEEGFEPAKEEAVRIFLEGGVPTSC